jgi:cell division protein FtsB
LAEKNKVLAQEVALLKKQVADLESARSMPDRKT